MQLLLLVSVPALGFVIALALAFGALKLLLGALMPRKSSYPEETNFSIGPEHEVSTRSGLINVS